MDEKQIKEILGLAYGYENQLSNYQYKNNQLDELMRTESLIAEKINFLLDNDELLLSMIKERWSLIKFVKDKKDKEFLKKACLINPICTREVNDVDLLVELYEANPETANYAVPYYKEQLEKRLQTIQQSTPQVFYDLLGQPHETIDEAMLNNEEIMKHIYASQMEDSEHRTR